MAVPLLVDFGGGTTVAPESNIYLLQTNLKKPVTDSPFARYSIRKTSCKCVPGLAYTSCDMGWKKHFIRQNNPVCFGFASHSLFRDKSQTKRCSEKVEVKSL